MKTQNHNEILPHTHKNEYDYYFKKEKNNNKK